MVFVKCQKNIAWNSIDRDAKTDFSIQFKNGKFIKDC